MNDMDEKRRAEILSDLRVLLNWLEANPDVPVDKYTVRISFHVSGDLGDEAGIAELHRIAEAAGVEPTGGSHHRVEVTFGTAQYQAVYIEREHMRRYDEHMRPYYEANRATAVSQA